MRNSKSRNSGNEVAELQNRILKLKEVNDFLHDENDRLQSRVVSYERMITKLTGQIDQMLNLL